MSLKRTLYFGSILTGLVYALPSAYADGVYLLQLGSFDTKEKAQARWESLQGKYPDALGNLDVRLMDVTLPPDNFKVYRTQAGALSSRADAQGICDQLGARGDECYVVETAMFNEGSRANVPNPPLSIEGQPMSAGRPAAAAVAAPVAEAPKAAVSAPVVAPVAEPVPVPVAIATPKTPVEKARAMEKEVAEDEDSGGFWSRLNPFSDDEPEPAAKADERDEGEYPSLKTDAELASKTPAISAPAPTPVMETPVAAVAPVAVEPVAPRAAIGQQLPPPPPQSAAMQAVQQQRVAAEQRAAMGSPFPASAPNAPQPVMAPVFAPQGAAPAAPQPTLNGSGDDVAVAEAIRVPLSEQVAPAPSPFSAYPSVDELKQLGMPSQASGAKTLWAQVSYFTDQQAALGFWEGYRAANRELPPVRVRVTSPYMAVAGKSRVSLRVGPFEKAEHINHFCSTIQADELRCSLSADMGSSGSARFDRSAAMPESRYVQRQAYSASPMHWVQLGTYGSMGEANGEWSRISTMQRPLLDSLQPNIAPPAMGSSTSPRYRLRTGPYVSRLSADELCTKLSNRGTKCVVTFGR